MEVLVVQSHPTLCDSMDCSPPGSSVHGSSPGKNTGMGCHLPFAICHLPGDLPNPGIKPRSPTLQADSLSPEPLGFEGGIETWRKGWVGRRE